MFTFLLSIVVLSALIYAGYRITMYLYSRGAIGNRSRTMRQTESAGIESLPIPVVRRMTKRERDKGLRPVRIGLVLVIGFVVMLVVLAISVLISLFH